MRDVKEFHRRFLADKMLPLALVEKRRKLITEEFYEVSEALEDLKKCFFYDNPPEKYLEHLAKELADLLIMVYGTADELDIPIEEVFAKVHQSNMEKIWPDGQVHYNEYGKVIKPPTHSPPDLSFIHGDRFS